MQNIICYRIDDRLIHGQVAAVWTKYLKQTRIVVVDDEANKDDLQKQILKLACPPGVKLSVLSIDKTIDNFNNNKYDGDDIFMISKDPKTIAELISKGFDYYPKEIIVGNMSGSPSKKQIKRGTNVDDEDIESFKYINDRGIELIGQSLPSEERVDIYQLISR